MQKPERAFSFKRERRTGVMGVPLFNYTLSSGGEEFILTATESGVLVSGTVRFDEQGQLETFARTLSQAWQEHLKLKTMAL